MAIVVACSLPAGLSIEHGGLTVNLNGAHVGLNPELLPNNGGAPDTELRGHGFGLTNLTGDQETAFLAWADGVTKGPNGEKLQHPFAPIASGALIWAKSEAEVRKEASNSKVSLGGLDPTKDLPDGMQTAEDPKKGK